MPARLAVPAAAAALLVFFAASASGANFTCTARATCRSAMGYTVPNATTYGELATRFNVSSLLDLLGANGLPATTAATARVHAAATVAIPFRCRCSGSNGVGQSDRVPVYVVQPQDGLDAIARNVFDAFVTYQEIAAANNIPDPNKIYVGQRLWIPLPCSCDQVGGADVMHFAYSVLGGDSTSAIAAKYGVSENTLLTLNKITDPKNLQKGQILDVPLPGK
jgi:chitin elicitor-binding protein